MPCFRKRPASAISLGSALTAFRQMNINELRHVAGLNKVRIKVGKRDGCKPRVRTKAEMLIDIERKLDEGGPLLASKSSSHGTGSQLMKTDKKRPRAKDVVEQMEAKGKSRCQTRAVLWARGFSMAHINVTTRHMHKKRPRAKDVVEKMEARGKSRCQTRAALRACGFSLGHIIVRTRYMDPPTAPFAKDRVEHKHCGRQEHLDRMPSITEKMGLS